MTLRQAFWLAIAGLATGCVGVVMHAIAPQVFGFGMAGFLVLLLAVSG